MFRVLAGVLALCAAVVATVFGQAPAAEPVLMPQWSLATGFAAPESAFYDAASNAVFVSSINGQILDKDGNGYISRLSPDGTVMAEKWATGVNAPKGLRSARGVLYAADIDTVVGFDIKSGKEVSRVKIDGAVFLNDLATAPDGTIYVSDSTALKIFEVRNGTPSVFVEGGNQVEQPNGLLVDGGRLILGSVGPAPVPGRAVGGGGGGRPRRGGRAPLRVRSEVQAAHPADGGTGGRHRRHRARWPRRADRDRRHRPAAAAREQGGNSDRAGGGPSRRRGFRLPREAEARDRAVPGLEQRRGLRPHREPEVEGGL
jgi:hypothetical protein